MIISEIPLQPNAQTFKTSLLGVTYIMTLVYRGGWLLSIADSLGNPLVAGLSLVTGCDLMAQLEYLGLGGILQVQTDGLTPDAVPTFANLGLQSHLYFTTP